jgi:hypothetical protein
MKTVEPTTADQTADLGAQGAHVAPEKAAPTKAASRKNGAPEGRKTGKVGKAGKTKAATPKKAGEAGKKAARPERNAASGKKATATKKASAPRAESKGAKILEMIRRPKGATLAEIMRAVQWQAHSVRGFISTAGKKQGIKIESAKNDAGDRVYKIAK